MIILILRVLNFDGAFGQDPYEYLRYSNAIRQYIINGTDPGNFYWPVLYPFVGSLLGIIFENTINGLQFLSCISFSLSCVYLLKTLNLLYPYTSHNSLYVLSFGLFSPFFLKMGLVIMSDATAILFIVLSFYYFFKYKLKKASIVPVFFFITCAFMTRYPSIIITFPIICYSLSLTLKRKKAIPFIIATLVSSIVFIPFVILKKNHLFDATSNYFLNSWSTTHFFSSKYTTVDGVQSYLFPNIIHVFYIFFHPGFIFIGVFLSWFIIKDYKNVFLFPQNTILVCIAVYLFFMAGIPFQNIRVLGLVFPIVLLFFAPYFNALINYPLFKKKTFLFAVITITTQLFLWSITFRNIFKRAVLEQEVTSIMQPYQGKKLYSFDVDLCLQGRDLNFNYKNLFVERYQNFKKNDLILYHPSKFREQWKNKNPELNWKHIQTKYELKVLENISEGWKLYEIINIKNDLDKNKI